MFGRGVAASRLGRPAATVWMLADVLLDEGFDVFFASGPDHAVDFFSAFEDEKGGDAHDIELPGEVAIGIDINFKDFGLSG